MARMWIVVGDMTSSGGRVLTGSACTDIDGKPVSRMGDKATCPLHKGVFPIADGEPTTIIDGQPVALHGSKLACGCTVLAVQQTRVFIDAGRTGSTPASASTGSTVVAKKAISGLPQFDEAFILTSQLTGDPLAHRRYRIILANGTVETGTTDEKGMTHLVVTPQAHGLSVEIGEQEVPA